MCGGAPAVNSTAGGFDGWRVCEHAAVQLTLTPERNDGKTRHAADGREQSVAG
jgi:hypothetical protein